MTGLWGGRFSGEMAPSMASLNRSLDVDHRLWPQDIRGSRAWAEALVKAGVITQEEGGLLLEGLERVTERLRVENFSEAPDEDIHSLVERLLQEEIGSTAGKLHTGRSRNDQVATDLRLWGMDAAAKVEEALSSLLEALLFLAEENVDVVLPGYTHLQQAQPLRGGHWVLSHFWPLARDRKRVRDARLAASSLPLGSGALAGCAFNIDREWLRDALGFRKISENSLDAVSDRDWAMEMAFAGALLGVHLSRLGEDLVLFSSKEFGVLGLPEGFCTGSSLMPQKRNPDAAELARGKAGRLVGNLTGLLCVLKGLPTGYNRDLQEDKKLLFDTVDTLLLLLPAMSEMTRDIRFQPDHLAARMDPGLLATDLADDLVRRGVPFRESHEAVGRLVRASEERGVPLSQLPPEAFREAHPAFDGEISQVFSFEGSVESRDVPGGTSLRALKEQLLLARGLLED